MDWRTHIFFTLFSLLYFEITLVNYFHIVAALVAIGSLVNFSLSVDLKRDQYTATIISEIYKKEMSEALSMLGRLFNHTNTNNMLKQKNIIAIEEFLSENNGVELSVIRILNYLESIAIFQNKFNQRKTCRKAFKKPGHQDL